MKFGICLPVENYNRIFNTGADYMEINASAVYNMSEEYFKKLCDELQDKKVTYSCNCLVVSDLRLTGNDVDYDKINAYCKKTFSRLADLGVKMLVFGSGNAKRVPEGFPHEKAWQQLFEVGKIFSDYAGKYSQTIAVEALRYAEVNIVNTIEDAAYYIKNVDRSNFKMLADFYHMHQNNESLDVIEKYKDDIVHIHMAGPMREMPDKNFKSFAEERMSVLKNIGYNGGVSFECAMSENDDEVRAMIDWYRNISE